MRFKAFAKLLAARTIRIMNAVATIGAHCILLWRRCTHKHKHPLANSHNYFDNDKKSTIYDRNSKYELKMTHSVWSAQNN